MFFDTSRIDAIRSMILSETKEERQHNWISFLSSIRMILTIDVKVLIFRFYSCPLTCALKNEKLNRWGAEYLIETVPEVKIAAQYKDHSVRGLLG